MPEIETPRLRLRPYTLNDVDELAAILSNPEVMRYSPKKGRGQRYTAFGKNLFLPLLCLHGLEFRLKHATATRSRPIGTGIKNEGDACG
ncbi:MAG: GNAT family N-acetyltransferase [Heteroscytonema crispum UTEX LB 1556]